MKLRWAAIALLGLAALWRHHPAARPIRLATFNIEEFPKDARQIEGAFDEIARLDAGFVAVQEIHDGRVFADAARRRLGDTWQFVQAERGVKFDLGVVFDSSRFALVSTRVRDEARVGGNNKPAFEVRLAPADGGAIIRVIVIHFRCCTEGRLTRTAQHRALAGIVREAQRSGDRVVVLGDFNATDDGDRADLAALARDTGLVWATESLACTAFWARDDGCPRSRLDHVLTWEAPATVGAAGACATEGCEWQDRCPLYREQISDHCPVVVTLDR